MESPVKMVLTDAFAEVISSLIGVLMVSALLEPEEVEMYTAGIMGFEEVGQLLRARIPNGGQLSAARLIRSFGIRFNPSLLDQCFESFQSDGFPINTWLMRLENRVAVLEEIINTPPDAERERERERV